MLVQCVIIFGFRESFFEIAQPNWLEKHVETIIWIIFWEILLLGAWVMANSFKITETSRPENKKDKAPEVSEPAPCSKSELEVKLSQYEQLWTEIREYSKEMWQIPSVVGVINSLLLPTAITFSSKTSPLHILIFPLLGTAFLLTLTFTVALHKHQFFQEKAINEREQIEEFLRNNYRGKKIIWGTENVHKAIYDGELKPMKTGWWTHRIAHNWLLRSMYAILALILVIALFELL